jgi:hypothetical protein
LADPTESSLLREIDEELRQERLKKLWQRHGWAVAVAALAVVAAVAGYQGWRAYDLKARREAGERLAAAQALAERAQPEVAAAAFAELARDAGSGYALLARFQEAALLARSGDRAGAAARYRALAEGAGGDALYRDLAVLLGAMHEAGMADPALLAERIEPLTRPGNPWRHSARELAAALAEMKGERQRAKELYAALGADAEAPESLRRRADEMLEILERR